jgi:hypothetical protein
VLPPPPTASCCFEPLTLSKLVFATQKSMYNAEKRGKKQVLLRPSSKVVIKFLQVMMKHGESSTSFGASVSYIYCPALTRFSGAPLGMGSCAVTPGSCSPVACPIQCPIQ